MRVLLQFQPTRHNSRSVGRQRSCEKTLALLNYNALPFPCVSHLASNLHPQQSSSDTRTVSERRGYDLARYN
eukprot:5703699-Pleurochrysis_carterae.AAC.2